MADLLTRLGIGKPRLKRHRNGGWECRGSGIVRYGVGPRMAYLIWEEAVVESRRWPRSGVRFVTLAV